MYISRSKFAYEASAFCAPRPSPHYDLDPFWDQKKVFLRSKKWSKNEYLQKLFFWRFFVFFRNPRARFSSILGPKMAPGSSFFGVLAKTAILSKSCSRCGGNTIFKGHTLQKSTRRATPKGNGTKKRRKSHPLPISDALFRPQLRFWSIFGSRIGPKIHEKCGPKCDGKKFKKKNTKMR